MLESAKGFAAGVILTLVIVLLIQTAYAAKVAAVFDDVRVFLFGDQLTVSQDSEPFIYNDRAYVPVKAFTEQLGMTVSWDSETRSAYVDKAAPAEARMNISRIIVSHFHIFSGEQEFTLDFDKNQLLLYDQYYHRDKLEYLERPRLGMFAPAWLEGRAVLQH